MKELKFRILKNSAFKFMIIVISLIAIVPLFLIIFYILGQGISAINLDFLISLPKPLGEGGGGVLNALVGTLILILIASILSIPLGILSAIYISEHKNSRIASVTRLSVDILQGVPSIVIGIIGYMWIVLSTGGFSALSGGVALGLMMLPVVIKSTEETLKLIPFSLKEAALSLGVPYYRTMVKVILPASLSGIVTGALVGIARIAGETAPLLFTAFGNPFLNTNVLKPVESLSLVIFNYATSPYSEWHKIAWGASCILLIFVLLLNLITRVVTKRWKIQF